MCVTSARRDMTFGLHLLHFHRLFVWLRDYGAGGFHQYRRWSYNCGLGLFSAERPLVGPVVMAC